MRKNLPLSMENHQFSLIGFDPDANKILLLESVAAL